VPLSVEEVEQLWLGLAAEALRAAEVSGKPED
jgi:hypothetical protein